jgi:septum formation protein
MEPLLLASTSPRRQEILKNLGIPYTVMSPAYDEHTVDGMAPHDLAEYHAMKKVESVMRMNLTINAFWILGADTLIVSEGKPLGKPADRADAERMIRAFSGKTHEVVTAISLFDASKQFISCKTSVSEVSFMSLDDRQIEGYLDTGEWQGVAGAYRIQGYASCFISSIRGSYSGIMGLPIHELYAILREHGYAFLF